MRWLGRSLLVPHVPSRCLAAGLIGAVLEIAQVGGSSRRFPERRLYFLPSRSAVGGGDFSQSRSCRG